MSTDELVDVYEVEIVNEGLLEKENVSKAAAKGYWVAPKWVPAVVGVATVLVLIGGAFAIGYSISYPHKVHKPLKLYNDTCKIFSGDCDDTRGLYCPSGLCICQVASTYYNGSYCVCGNYTHVANQACVPDGSYGQSCNPPTTNCIPNFICNSNNICSCNATIQFYNGSYCAPQYPYNSTCSQTSQCSNTSNLYCQSNVCTCVSDYYWNGVACTSKLVNGQTCNNITTGPSALPCDDTLSLFCNSNNTCQCPSTMYWDLNYQQCETKRLYGDICDADYYCNETLGFICPTIPGTCNCPTLSNDYTCDCQPNWFYDGLRCISRKSINGTCIDTYACDRNTPLVCYAGLCLCPTPTAWSGTNCTCATGQTWTGTTCVTVG